VYTVVIHNNYASHVTVGMEISWLNTPVCMYNQADKRHISLTVYSYSELIIRHLVLVFGFDDI